MAALASFIFSFYDTLSAEDLMKDAVIMAVFAYEAALSPERIPRKTIVVEEASPEKKAAPAKER
jgi:hypothetical protein